jgi:hypothetical protein
LNFHDNRSSSGLTATLSPTVEARELEAKAAKVIRLFKTLAIDEQTATKASKAELKQYTSAARLSLLRRVTKLKEILIEAQESETELEMSHIKLRMAPQYREMMTSAIGKTVAAFYAKIAGTIGKMEDHIFNIEQKLDLVQAAQAPAMQNSLDRPESSQVIFNNSPSLYQGQDIPEGQPLEASRTSLQNIEGPNRPFSREEGRNGPVNVASMLRASRELTQQDEGINFTSNAPNQHGEGHESIIYTSNPRGPTNNIPGQSGAINYSSGELSRQEGACPSFNENNRPSGNVNSGVGSPVYQDDVIIYNSNVPNRQGEEIQVINYTGKQCS